MKTLRTPDDRFVNLPDYSFSPSFMQVVDGLDQTPIRIHYLDEGSGSPILLLHGEPTWSYVFRHLIPPLSRAGYRVLAPDLVGFGKSDKPSQASDYTCNRMVGWMASWLDQMELGPADLIVHDWGGVVGLRMLAEKLDRFKRIVALNTSLPCGELAVPQEIATWRQVADKMPALPIGQVVSGGCRTELDPEVIAAYDAPFPTEAYKAGPRAVPGLLPVDLDDPAIAANRKVWKVLRNWEKPFLTIYGDSDPFSRGFERRFQEQVPGAADQEHVRLRDAGNILLEDRPKRLSKLVLRFLRRS